MEGMEGTEGVEGWRGRRGCKRKCVLTDGIVSSFALFLQDIYGRWHESGCIGGYIPWAGQGVEG